MMSDDELRAVLIAEARRMAEQAGENPDSMTVDEDSLAQVMLAGRAVERAAYERAAQKCDELRRQLAEAGESIARQAATIRGLTRPAEES